MSLINREELWRSRWNAWTAEERAREMRVAKLSRNTWLLFAIGTGFWDAAYAGTIPWRHLDPIPVGMFLLGLNTVRIFWNQGTRINDFLSWAKRQP